MITTDDIKSFLNNKDYDIRKSHNGRWIDQKCTPDVVEIISDCILNYVKNDAQKEFLSIDIWQNDYSIKIIEDLFKKPSPDDENARNEYDKFFQQPMEMLSYARILSKRKDGIKNTYKVERTDLLGYIATSARNSLSFMTVYITKVLKDSGLLLDFESFFANQTAETYADIKNIFTEFTKDNTPINGETESWRIFTKVINPLAYERSCFGTERGRLCLGHDTFGNIRPNKSRPIT